MLEEGNSGPGGGVEEGVSRLARMLKRLFEPPRVPEEFEAETRRLVLSRLRLVLVIALVLTPAFIPLDYFRVPQHFGAVVAMRVGACVVFAILLPMTWRPSAARHALALSATVIAVIAGYLAGVAPLTEGAHDPVYMQQSTALVFVIMGIGLLFPVDGRRLVMLGGIPLALQIVATLDFDLIDNLPMLTLSTMALLIATVGAGSAFATRLGDWEGRAAKEALLRARSDFVAMLTHDIKNPLGAVGGYVSLLREDQERPAEDREILGRIEAANQTALLLATNFLDVSTIEASGVTISARPTDVGELLRRVLSEQRSQAETKSVELELDARLDLPLVEADPALLCRIFANLINNAIKFTPRGGAVRASARADGEGHVEVVVEDTGEGIPPDAMSRIFQRYSRASSRSDSTGLGLYIVRTFTEAHGGTVFAENRDDRLGARVGVRLPLRRTAGVTDSRP